MRAAMNNETPTMTPRTSAPEFSERRLDDAHPCSITEADFRSSLILHTSDFGDGYLAHRAIRNGRFVAISQAPAAVIAAMLTAADQA